MTGTCSQCHQATLELTSIRSQVTGEAITVGKCRQCDVRHCKCGRYVQSPIARVCPACGRQLFGE